MLRRMTWFIGLWIASVLVVSVVTFGLRALVG
jgi:hypothetical protein